MAASFRADMHCRQQRVLSSEDDSVMRSHGIQKNGVHFGDIAGPEYNIADSSRLAEAWRLIAEVTAGEKLVFDVSLAPEVCASWRLFHVSYRDDPTVTLCSEYKCTLQVRADADAPVAGARAVRLCSC